MSQCHRICKSFKDRVASTAALNAALAGDLHHGARVDTSIPRPFGMITVKETNRESHSGMLSLVSYEAELKIVGEQEVGEVGAAQEAFAEAFDLTTDLPSVVGDVILCYPQASTITEDQDSEFGKDIIIGTQSWIITIQE